jgi:predicted transcriptional regulator
MSTDEIKSRLHESIENIDDNEFLLTIKDLIEHKYQPEDPPKLSEWQLNRIMESENQIKKGEFLTNDQVDRAIDKWLEE